MNSTQKEVKDQSDLFVLQYNIEFILCVNKK